MKFIASFFLAIAAVFSIPAHAEECSVRSITESEIINKAIADAKLVHEAYQDLAALPFMSDFYAGLNGRICLTSERTGPGSPCGGLSAKNAEINTDHLKTRYRGGAVDTRGSRGAYELLVHGLFLEGDVTNEGLCTVTVPDFIVRVEFPKLRGKIGAPDRIHIVTSPDMNQLTATREFRHNQVTYISRVSYLD